VKRANDYQDAYEMAGVEANGHNLTNLTDLTDNLKELPAAPTFPVDAMPRR